MARSGIPPTLSLCSSSFLLLLALFGGALSACPPKTTANGADLFAASFGGEALSFSWCQDLNQAAFFWNFSNGVLSSLYENSPAEPYGWIAWGNSQEGRMFPSQVVIAFGDPSTPGKNINVSAWTIPSYNPATFQVLSDEVANFTGKPAVDIRDNGTVMAIRSEVGYNQSRINLISGNGPGFNFTTGLFMKHLKNPKITGIDVVTGSRVPVMPFIPGGSVGPEVPGAPPSPGTPPAGTPPPASKAALRMFQGCGSHPCLALLLGYALIISSACLWRVQ